MAGKGDINIPITGDASDFIRETGDVEDALKDVSDSLDDMARDTKKGGRDAERAVDELADSFDDARKKARDLGDAGNDAGRSVEKGMDKAKGSTDEFKREADSTAKESAASFDGSAESIIGAFQEIAANAFAGFGPAGAIAGLAAAAGIGLATAGFTAVEEERAKLEEKANDLAQAYVEAGSTMLGAMDLAARSLDVITSTDPKDKQDLADLTELLGDRALAIRILAGDSAALATAQAIQRGREDALADASIAATNNTGKRKTAIGEEAEAVERLTGILGAQAGLQDAASQKSRDYSATLLSIVDDAADATIAVDDFGNKLIELPDGTRVVVSADTGIASTNIDNFKGDIDKLPKSKAVVVKGTVDLDKSNITNYKPTVRANFEAYDRFGRRAI